MSANLSSPSSSACHRWKHIPATVAVPEEHDRQRTSSAVALHTNKAAAAVSQAARTDNAGRLPYRRCKPFFNH
ncbi:hypothetical protein CBM2598_P130003 [Cupriavidus taiwanensis]|uniref:Uncharacterized protein n=1 Tax=Cupriavidus taiwanensis TaxID=164546 RepID=A0A7Z7JEI1_9BURK|nr:hypothetical protein CBM2598_P130003 [Cupriavidus taiwanensis]SPC25112.1 hypothetical protein CBM2594_P110003 [Cupriavidus taiwanensis]